MDAKWIEFKQYEGFAILDDASKIRTPDGVEHELRPDKLFYFINPNTQTKNFAKPDVLLKRAQKAGAKSAITKSIEEILEKKEPKPPKEKKVKAPKEKKVKAEEMPAPKVNITLTGKEALQKAVDTKCELYYNTKQFGWYKSIRDPAAVLASIEESEKEGYELAYPLNGWGVAI